MMSYYFTGFKEMTLKFTQALVADIASQKHYLEKIEKENIEGVLEAEKIVYGFLIRQQQWLALDHLKTIKEKLGYIFSAEQSKRFKQIQDDVRLYEKSIKDDIYLLTKHLLDDVLNNKSLLNEIETLHIGGIKNGLKIIENFLTDHDYELAFDHLNFIIEKLSIDLSPNQASVYHEIQAKLI